MNKDQFAEYMTGLVGSLDSFSVVVKVKQNGEEVQLLKMEATAKEGGLEAEVEVGGGFTGAILAAYLLHKAEESAKETAKEANDETQQQSGSDGAGGAVQES